MRTHVHGCVCACVHEGVRLIEVVRVKMIPSGGHRGMEGWGGVGAGGLQQWVTEKEKERGMRWMYKGASRGVKGIAPHPQCSESLIHEKREMK